MNRILRQFVRFRWVIASGSLLAFALHEGDLVLAVAAFWGTVIGFGFAATGPLKGDRRST